MSTVTQSVQQATDLVETPELKKYEKMKNRKDQEHGRRINPIDKLVGLDGGFSNLKFPVPDNKKRRNSLFSISALSSRSAVESWTKCLKGDPVTPRGKVIQKSKVVFFTMVPVLILIGMNVSSLIINTSSVSLAETIERNVLFSTQAGRVMHYLQIERGNTALYVGSNASPLINVSLQASYPVTNEAVENLTMWYFSAESAPYMASKERLHEYIQNHRGKLNVLSTTVKNEISFYSDMIGEFIDWVARSIQREDRGGLWRTLVAYHMLILSKEQAGVERALGAVYFAKGKFTMDDHLWYVEKNFYGKTYLARCIEYSPSICAKYYGKFKDSALDVTLGNLRKSPMANNVTQPSVARGDSWFKDMTTYIDFLKEIEDALSLAIIDSLDKEKSGTLNNMTLSIIVLIIVTILAPITIAFVFSIIHDIQIYATDLKEKSDELLLEKEQTTRLLYQMLPKSIAKKLRMKEPVSPEKYDNVTIFFSDIVGFTAYATELRPVQIVEILNTVYRTLDVRIELYDTYKVETIGDAYMVVSGCPERNGDNHAKEIGLMALDLLDCISTLPLTCLDGEYLKLRAGIHSGPCVAGVVGFKMPRYCLFGETVYTASRIEAGGHPNKIHVSAQAYSIMREYPIFLFEDRGLVKIRGKGFLQTHWLLGKSSLLE